MLQGLVAALIAGAPFAAQPPPAASFDLSTAMPDPPFRAERGVRLPVIDYSAPDGSRRLSSGIIAGLDVAPRTTIGIGLFNTRRARSSLAPDPQLDRAARGRRKAAIGINFKF